MPRKKRTPRIADTLPPVLDRLCEDLGFTSAELAEATHFTRPKISQYRNGKELPTLRTLQRLVDGVDKTLTVSID